MPLFCLHCLDKTDGGAEARAKAGARLIWPGRPILVLVSAWQARFSMKAVIWLAPFS
jgi:hypothetical protein